MGLTVPRQRIREERRARGWSQEKLAEEMTALREQQMGGDCPSSVFTFQQVARIEAGRVEVRFDDASEPLLWMMKALGLPISFLLTKE